MSREQRLVKRGLLDEKMRDLKDVTSGLKARINAISTAIMPELDIEDQGFSQAKTLLDECISLKGKYDALGREIKALEEDLGVSEG